MQALASLIGSIVSSEASEAIGRARRTALLYLIAGLLLICGAGFLVAAGFMSVARQIGALPASLWFGGGFVVLALILVFTDRLMMRARAANIARRRREETRAVASAATIALLPVLLASSRARSAALGLPVLAALAYGIWRENRPNGGDGN